MCSIRISRLKKNRKSRIPIDFLTFVLKLSVLFRILSFFFLPQSFLHSTAFRYGCPLDHPRYLPWYVFPRPLFYLDHILTPLFSSRSHCTTLVWCHNSPMRILQGKICLLRRPRSNKRDDPALVVLVCHRCGVEYIDHHSNVSL